MTDLRNVRCRRRKSHISDDSSLSKSITSDQKSVRAPSRLVDVPVYSRMAIPRTSSFCDVLIAAAIKEEVGRQVGINVSRLASCTLC